MNKLHNLFFNQIMMYFRQYFAVFLLSKILAKKCTEGEYCVRYTM